MPFCLEDCLNSISITHTGYRIVDGGMMTDLQEANALSHAIDIIDIYTVTSRVPDSGSEVDGPGMLAKMALKTGATEVSNTP